MGLILRFLDESNKSASWWSSKRDETFIKVSLKRMRQLIDLHAKLVKYRKDILNIQEQEKWKEESQYICAQILGKGTEYKKEENTSDGVSDIKSIEDLIATKYVMLKKYLLMYIHFCKKEHIF